MAESLPHFCPHCGTEAIPKQKFCPKCGLDMPAEVLVRPPTQSSDLSVAQVDPPASDATANSVPDAGLGPASNLSSNPALKSGASQPSVVPKRPLTQPASPVLPPPTKVARPTLTPLNEASHLAPEQPLAQAPPASSPADDAIVSLPTQMLPQAQVQETQQSVRQTQAEAGLEAPSELLASTKPESLPAKDAIVSLPTQMLPQLQVLGPLRSSMQTQARSVLQFLTGPSTGRLDRRRIGVLLLLIVIIGGVGFGIIELVYALNAPPSQPPIITTTLGTTVNYAGIDITVVNAQKSQSFVDDPNATSNGMLRLQLRAQNKTSLTLNLPYETIAHLTLPSGQSVGQADKPLSPAYVKSDEHLAPNAQERDLVDFAVPQNVRVDQLIFHIGREDEAQLDIPLNGHANVDQYTSKIVHSNQQLFYAGLVWTLTDASLQFHIDGQQASKGMRYLILVLKVDNPLLEKVISGSPNSYVHLKDNNNNALSLNNSTLPVAFDSGASGKMGTLTFLVPRDDVAFALTFSNPSDGFDVSNTVNFQF